MVALAPDVVCASLGGAAAGRIVSLASFFTMRVNDQLSSPMFAARLLFVFISAIIILGVGSSYSYAACSGGIWLWCAPFRGMANGTVKLTSTQSVLLYAGTKAILYILLLEKLAIVHSHTSGGRTSRCAEPLAHLVSADSDFLRTQSNPGGTAAASSFSPDGLPSQLP